MPPPYVIPFFIAHQGCPHRCTFCNQHAITGNHVVSGLSAEQIQTGIAEQLLRPRLARRQGVQVAFYGGSFTGLSRDRQREMLEAVQPFIDNNEVGQIRLSTRPDYINADIVDFLKSYRVGIVELGVQSMSDEVLTASGRGHSVADTERAIKCLQEGGLEVGVQLMIGLPGDRAGLIFRGAERLAALGPDLARIYPTMVIKGSGLEDDYRSGLYRPLSLAKAVAISGRVKKIFTEHGVRVVRIGLQETDSLKDDIVAGPYHPAFGELVLARNMFRQVSVALAGLKGQGHLIIRIAATDQSVFRGQANSNLKRLAAKGLLDDVELVFEEKRLRGTVEVVPSGG